GGEEDVLSGGTVIGTTLRGGVEGILSGGTAISTTVSSGVEFVGSGGTARGTTIAGGTMEVTPSAPVSGPIAFTHAGGILQLDASQSFHGTIAGFASPPGVTEEIDLRDIDFAKKTRVSFKEDKNNLSGTLTVTDGTHTANLTLLGQYSANDFSLASDGHGG